MAGGAKRRNVSRQKLLIIIGGLIIVLILVLVFGLKSRIIRPEPATLEFWSVYDDEDIYKDLILAYQEKNKHITINYHKKSFSDYEKDLVNALAAGQGPDIFSIHNTWISKHYDKISSLPSLKKESLMTILEFKNSFVDVAAEDFIEDEKIYALPLHVDTLALFYNKDILNSAGIPNPPSTWEEFMDDVEILTRKDDKGNIVRAGAAMGTAENINRSTDILGLFMLQSGAEMVSSDRKTANFNQTIYTRETGSYSPGEDALRFYTSFSDPLKRVYCWNRQMPYSIDAFYQGKAAMMISYSYHISTILAKSPYLNFGIAPVPQIKGREFDVNYPNYWGLTVSKNSKHSEEAWKFILYLTEKENLKIYLTKAKRPSSRRDLIEWQKDDLYLSAFATQTLSAKSWYQVDDLAIESIFADMIESVVLGTSVKEALNRAANQVTVLMK